LTWKLEGYDTFSGETYPLGYLQVQDGVSRIDGLRPSYPDYASALTGARKRLADLERTQPAASSGGQGTSGIQDRVYIIHPDGRRERVL
jgi:hypothetical protein